MKETEKISFDYEQWELDTREDRERHKIEFKEQLEKLLNMTCQENGSDTPDYILAEYLIRCLDNFNKTIQQRETHYGRELYFWGPNKVKD